MTRSVHIALHADGGTLTMSVQVFAETGNEKIGVRSSAPVMTGRIKASGYDNDSGFDAAARDLAHTTQVAALAAAEALRVLDPTVMIGGNWDSAQGDEGLRKLTEWLREERPYAIA